MSCAGSRDHEIILATTTSTENSGLLDVLIPRYEAETGDTVKVIAVGSGAALRMGERGDADVLLVHSPEAEEAFMAAGHGASRARFMYNDFVIVGPAEDAAAIQGGADDAGALAAIAPVEAPFFSRGDQSGTHAREQALWGAAGMDVPTGASWYSETGQRMAATLVIAAQRGAYTITDRATWLALGDDFSLPALVEGDSQLLNVYHAIVVNPATHDRVNDGGARRLSEFLLREETLRLIGEFGRERYGIPLFTPYRIEVDDEPAGRGAMRSPRSAAERRP